VVRRMRRLVGRLLQCLGAGSMLIGLLYAAGFRAPAYAAIMAPVARFVRSFASTVAIVPVASPSPSPSPSPSVAPGGIVLPNATPTPKAYRATRGGPLEFGLSGSLSFGSRSINSTQYSPFGVASPSPSASPSGFIGSTLTTNQSLAQESVGMLAELTRRTGSTMTDIKLPLGFGSQGTQLGLVQAIFSTPKYAIGYGSQVLTLFGQIPAGGTQRGPFMIVPLPAGDATFYEGPAIGALSETVPLYGVRIRHLGNGALYEAGLAFANGLETGKSVTAILGGAASRGPLTLTGEAAAQHRQGGDANASGLTYQLRLDDGGTNTYVTAILRHVSNNFVAFGNGEIYGDDYEDFGYHKNATLQNFSFDISRERIGNTLGGASTNRQESMTYGGPARFGQYTVSLQSQNTGGSGLASQWVGTAIGQFSANLGHGFLLLGSQASRTTQSFGGNVGSSGFNASLEEPLGSITFGASYQAYRQISQLYGRTTIASEGFNATRTWGRTSLGLSETFSHTYSAQSAAVQTNPLFTVTRQISPVISVQTSIGYQTLRDPLNPAANGKSRTFSFQINAPFSYGNSIVTGRTDARLPATIVGKVLTDAGTNASFAGLASSGVSNILIVLDNQTIQRTDVTGGFQFSFVTPGQHQLRIENSSLPRGVTADQPIATISVLGGQTAQVIFQVGNFGGISGHVYGRDDTGAIVPLPNVLLRVDGGAYSQTDGAGAYGFGRLRPGKHTVTIVPQSVPAFASFSKASETEVVQVHDGVYTPLNFDAEPLGSISGSIMFAPELASENMTGPVPNAYVVAEPGEHAAIVDDGGDFIIDNLPPGDYSVSVDPETLPDGTGATPDSVPVALGSEEHYHGLRFLVGHAQKKVVFSFLGSGATASAPAQVQLSEQRLPPHGIASVSVDAPKSAERVRLEAFGALRDLVYDDRRSAWVGDVIVPATAKAGTYTIAATVASGTKPTSAKLVVDPKMPIAILQVQPANPIVGQYVRVRARFLVDVREGDRIEWQDGTTTILGKPVVGRIFTFSLRISLRPLHGVLLTKGSRLPISLM